jgi:lysine-N-methylase
MHHYITGVHSQTVEYFLLLFLTIRSYQQMLNKTQKVIQPQYVSKFNCICSDCEDSCCQTDWGIYIDKQTYEKYNTLQNLELKSRLNEGIIMLDNDENNYAQFKMRPDGSCPMLDTDGLCLLQKNLGEDYLSKVCLTYPRHFRKINGVLEQTLTLSCPEAARLVLLNPDGIIFESAKISSSLRFNQMNGISTVDMKNDKNIYHYFWDLRIFIIDLLQNRTFPLWERLILIGLFLEQIDQLDKQFKIAQIPATIELYKNHTEFNNFQNVFRSLETDFQLQLKLMKTILILLDAHSIKNCRFVECLNEFKNAIDMHSEETTQIEHYHSAYTNYYQPFMQSHPYILENYLVNYVFKDLVPLTWDKYIFDNYAFMIGHYSIIKTLLIGISGYQKNNFNETHIIKLIQSFSQITQNNEFMLKFLQALQTEKYNTMPSIVALIKE